MPGLHTLKYIYLPKGAIDNTQNERLHIETTVERQTHVPS